MESEEGTSKNLMTNSPPPDGKVDRHASSKTSNTSFSISSSPDSLLDDSSHGLDRNSHKLNSTNSLSNNESSDNGALSATSPEALTCNLSLTNVPETQSPSPQVMEHPRSPSDSSPYRIPSSVFARSKSSTPMEWSVCSNESLFSIHMENMSFRNDDPFSFQSGELGPPGEVSTSGMLSHSSDQAPGDKATDSGSHELGLAEASMKELIRESEDNKDEIAMSDTRMSLHSHESGTSAKSFAFPILAGDIGHSASQRMASPVKVSPEEQQSHSQPLQKPEPESSAQPEPQTPTETQEAAPSKWFSCFLCCSFCK